MNLDLKTTLMTGVQDQANHLRYLGWFTLGVLVVVIGGLAREVRNGRVLKTTARRLADKDAQIRQAAAHSAVLEGALDELNAGNRELTDFTYALSHDLKSPTQTARMIIGMLQEDLADLPEPGPDTRENLADLDRVMIRMEAVIRDVLTFAGTSDNPAETEWIDLGDLLESGD